MITRSSGLMIRFASCSASVPFSELAVSDAVRPPACLRLPVEAAFERADRVAGLRLRGLAERPDDDFGAGISASPRLALGRAYRTANGLPTDKQLQQCLLRVTAIFGLIPDALAGPVQQLLRDLLAGMSRQAVQNDRARRGQLEQLGVDSER